MQNIVRGATIGWASTFTDELGASFQPAGVELRVTYFVSGVKATDTVVMAYSSGVWRATWNSAGADADQVDWFIGPTSGVKAVDEGSFMLVKNTANSGT